MLLEDEFGCKICGNVSLNNIDHNKHVINSHSTGAISIGTEIIRAKNDSGIKLPILK